MSAQSIIHPTIYSMFKEAEDAIISNAKKYIFKRNFALGDGYCDFEQLDAAITHDIISTNNCHLLSCIQTQLEDSTTDDEDIETLSEISNTSSITYNISSNQTTTLYNTWLAQGNTGTINDFLDLLLKDEDVQLIQNNW